MDLYSSLRVVRKWWYLALPLLLLTAVGALVAVSQVSGSKRASGEVVLLAAPTPPAATNENPNPPEANNPYALMALDDIVDVLSRTVTSDATARALELQGLRGTYTVEGNQNFQRGPIITIDTTAPDERAARRSYELVATELETTLDGLQDQVGANPAFRVKMQRLTTPEVTATSALTDLRAALIAVAIGLLLTLAVVFGAESISRGRARHAAQRASEDSTADAISTNGDHAPAPADDDTATVALTPVALEPADSVEMPEPAGTSIPDNGSTSTKHSAPHGEREPSETNSSASDQARPEDTGASPTETERDIVPSEES